MKIFPIISKKYGKFDVILDNNDFEKIVKMGKWNICILRGNAYVQKRIKKEILISLHRFLLDAKPKQYVDHINKNTLDNRRSNLRICSNSANIRNGKIRSNNKTGYTGINYSKYQPINPWVAQIRVKYKVIRIGSFPNFEDAYEARKKAELKYFNI